LDFEPLDVDSIELLRLSGPIARGKLLELEFRKAIKNPGLCGENPNGMIVYGDY